MATLDYWGTVQPAAGLVRGLGVQPPNGDTHLLWSVAADIGQQDWSGARASADDYPLTLVGACGMQRGDAFVRACGEAVERSALLPTTPLADAPSAPLLARGALWSPGAGEAPTYAAVELATGNPRRVPAPAVDYPLPVEPVPFDPTPSGAAAGPTYDAAVAAAVRELLERDAATIAWARQARLPAVDLPAMARGGDGTGRQLQKLLALAASRGLRAAAGVAPTAVPGVECVIGVMIDREAGLAAAGLAVASSTAAAVVKALQEALQVRSVLLGVTEHYRGAAAPAAVANDLDRARVWTTPGALAAMERWIAGFGPPVLPADRAPQWDATFPGAAVVDLTPRLPPAIRALGWHAVKALAPRLQPLRMSELPAWSWNDERLAAPEREWRIGCAVAPGSVEDCPHPFI